MLNYFLFDYIVAVIQHSAFAKNFAIINKVLLDFDLSIV